MDRAWNWRSQEPKDIDGLVGFLSDNHGSENNNNNTKNWEPYH